MGRQAELDLPHLRAGAGQADEPREAPPGLGEFPAATGDAPKPEPPRADAPGAADAPALPPAGERRWRAHWQALWWGALTVAVLALVVQLVHANRRAVVDWPGVGPVVAAIYAAAGNSVEPRLALARYAIVGASMRAAPGHAGVLQLTARVVNRAAFVQRLPLIRLTLTNRHGEAVASRLLLPSDYGAATINSLSAGRALTFHLRLVDPGNDAIGFKLVLCRHRDGTVLCMPG